jgi:hypothetical protein
MVTAPSSPAKLVALCRHCKTSGAKAPLFPSFIAEAKASAYLENHIWLGDQDSNLDKVRQRHLTYR